MKLMPFDIDYHLKAYNQTKKANKTRADFNFLQAFSSDTAASLALANELLLKSAQLGTKQPGNTRSELYENVTDQISNNDFKGIRQSLKQLSKFIEEDKLQAWYEDQHRRLRSPELWEQISSTAHNKSVKTQLSALKDQWVSTKSQYSAHSTSSLLFAAENIMTFFYSYYYFALLEFHTHKHRLPKKIRLAYQDYLATIGKDLREAKQLCAQNMLMRLQLAVAVGDIHYSDHIHYTVHFLNRNKLIKQKSSLPANHRCDLSSDQFLRFLDYITQLGTEEQKKSLLNLSIFAHDQQYIAWQNEITILIVPRALYNRGLVPVSAPWFPRLFTLRQFRYKFFEKNAWLFSSLRLLEKYPLKDNDIDSSIAHIKEIEERLENADHEILEKTLTGFQRLFNQQMVSFKTEWSLYHQEARIGILKKKIALIDSIHQNLSRHNATLLDFSSVRTIIDQICADLSKIHLPATECESFYRIKLALESKQKTTEKQTTTTSNQPQRSTNPFDSPCVSTNPFDTPSNNSLSKPSKTDPILLDLINNLNLMRLDLINFQEMISSVKKAITTIVQNAEPREKKLLKNAIEKIFIQYLKHMISVDSASSFEQHHEKIDAVEQLLINHSEEHIKSRIQSLIECRQKPDYLFSLKLKCRSYLASYQKKVVPYLITNSSILKTETPIVIETPHAPQLITAQ